MPSASPMASPMLVMGRPEAACTDNLSVHAAPGRPPQDIKLLKSCFGNNDPTQTGRIEEKRRTEVEWTDEEEERERRSKVDRKRSEEKGTSENPKVRNSRIYDSGGKTWLRSDRLKSTG